MNNTTISQDFKSALLKQPRLSIGWALSLAVLLYLWITTPEGFWIEAFFVAEIALLTAWTRSTTLRDGMVMFLVGIIAIAGGSLLMGSLFELFGANLRAVFWQSWFFPIVEEVFKLAPGFLVLWFLDKQYSMKLNPSDLIWLVAASSAGFSVVEKYFWETINFSFTYGPNIGNWYLFPDALGIRVSGETFGFIGHAAASVFVALLFGIGMHLQKRGISLGGFSPAYVVGAAGFAWITLEHILNNMYYGNGSDALLAIGGGRLTPWLFVAAAIVFIVLEVQSRKNVTDSTVQWKFADCWSALVQSISSLGKNPMHALQGMNLILRKYRLSQRLQWNVNTSDEQ